MENTSFAPNYPSEDGKSHDNVAVHYGLQRQCERLRELTFEAVDWDGVDAVVFGASEIGERCLIDYCTWLSHQVTHAEKNSLFALPFTMTMLFEHDVADEASWVGDDDMVFVTPAVYTFTGVFGGKNSLALSCLGRPEIGDCVTTVIDQTMQQLNNDSELPFVLLNNAYDLAIALLHEHGNGNLENPDSCVISFDVVDVAYTYCPLLVSRNVFTSVNETTEKVDNHTWLTATVTSLSPTEVRHMAHSSMEVNAGDSAFDILAVI